MSETDGIESPLDPGDLNPDDQVIQRTKMNGSPSGMRRADAEGLELIDALAGRASVFGFGFEPITRALQTAAEGYLGDATAFVDQVFHHEDPLYGNFMEILGDSNAVTADSISLCSSTDMAVETAIGWARRFRPEKSFRTIAFSGSDHGRSGLCRTASGRPELQSGYGPMMAGFTHVPPGDLDAIRSNIDDQTACLMLSPIDMRNAAVAMEATFLADVRQLCDEHDILLVVDESQIGFGSSGQPFAFSAIADIHADVVIVASGLFAGLPGGIVLASQRVTGERILDTTRYPLQSAVAVATLTSMQKQELPASILESMQQLAVTLAEKLKGFEFVRDIHALGMTIGVETDIESANIVALSARQGLRLESAGDVAFRIQLPLVPDPADVEDFLTRLGETMESIERETAELSL